MEQRAYQKWTRGLLLGLVLVLMACAAVVYRVDPCFYYRMPTDREPVFFSERYQTAGIVRNNPAVMEEPSSTTSAGLLRTIPAVW